MRLTEADIVNRLVGLGLGEWAQPSDPLGQRSWIPRGVMLLQTQHGFRIHAHIEDGDRLRNVHGAQTIRRLRAAFETASNVLVSEEVLGTISVGIPPDSTENGLWMPTPV